MARNDYIKIADRIRQAQYRVESGSTADRVIKRLAIDLADDLSADNERFNRDRFLKACGYGPTA